MKMQIFLGNLHQSDKKSCLIAVNPANIWSRADTGPALAPGAWYQTFVLGRCRVQMVRASARSAHTTSSQATGHDLLNTTPPGILPHTQCHSITSHINLQLQSTPYHIACGTTKDRLGTWGPHNHMPPVTILETAYELGLIHCLAWCQVKPGSTHPPTRPLRSD